MIDIGTDLACLVQKQAPAEASKPIADFRSTDRASPQIGPSPPAKPNPTMAFNRLARAIRCTIILASKFSEPPKAHAVPEPQREPRHCTAARQRLIRNVEDLMQRRIKSRDEAERLHAQFVDRLDDLDLEDDLDLDDEPDLEDDPDPEGDIAARPIADIIQDICSELGIAHVPGSHPWRRRAAADIAVHAAMNILPQTPNPLDTGVVVPMRPRHQISGAKSTDPR